MPLWKRIIPLLCLALLYTGSAMASPPQGSAGEARSAMATEILWHTDFAASLEEARRTGKRVLIDVYTDWCGWCKKLDRDTYTDSVVVQRLNREFICVKLNPESGRREQRIAQQYRVDGYPCIIVLEGDGRESGRISGYRNPDNFLRELNRILGTARTASEPQQQLLYEHRNSAFPPQTTTIPPTHTYKQAEIQRAEDLVRQSLALIEESHFGPEQGGKNLSTGAGLPLAGTQAWSSGSGKALYAAVSDYRLNPVPLVRCRAPLFPRPYEDFSHPNEDLDEIAANYDVRTDAEYEAALRHDLATAEDRLARNTGSGCTVADLANRLAFIRCKRGDFGGAERLYERAIEAQEPEGRNALLYIYQHNLALLYAVEGKYKDGEQLCRQLIAKTLQDLNPMFPIDALQKAARHISDLGCIYEAQQQHQKAEQLYRNSLAIFEELDGTMHPFLIRDIRNLTRLYEKQGRAQEAAEMHGRLVSLVDTNSLDRSRNHAR